MEASNKLVYFIVNGELGDSQIKMYINEELSKMLDSGYEIISRNETPLANGNLNIEYHLELNNSDDE